MEHDTLPGGHFGADFNRRLREESGIELLIVVDILVHHGHGQVAAAIGRGAIVEDVRQV